MRWMMNEERELLERCVSQFGNLRHDFNLLTKTKELLAQPEPIKEREVLGKIISTDDACNWNLTVDALKDYDHVYVNGIRYTEYQPDINTQYLLDQVSRLTAENAMIKEKWSEAQPEQEPSVKLPESEDEAVLMNLLSDNWLRNHAPHRLNALYLAPPKRMPLSESEIAAIWGDSDYDVDVVRAIEKAHGIGGGNE